MTDLTPVDIGSGWHPDPSSSLSLHADAPGWRFDRAAFVPERVPERIELKHEVFSTVEGAMSPAAVVASSASGLTLTEMQAGWRAPGRVVLGHQFNPPHLIPLVALLAAILQATAAHRSPT